MFFGVSLVQNETFVSSDLVGGDWNISIIFPYTGNFIIPIDELIFLRGVETSITNQIEHLNPQNASKPSRTDASIEVLDVA